MIVPPNSNILVIDLGLTNCKCLVFSASGVILAFASHDYHTSFPQAGWVEQDPQDWWQVICKLTREVWNRQSGLERTIDAISVTAHMHALVFLDQSKNPLGNAIILGDQRSLEQANAITNEVGLEMIYQVTGARMDASMPAAKIRWLKETSPAILSKTALFTGVKDYIRGRMTGDRLTDPVDACAMSMYDLHERSWSPQMCATAGVDIACLPEIVQPTSIAGILSHQAAQDLGLQEGIPVITGSGDDVEVIGNGLLHPGESLEHLGTTGSILSVTDTFVSDPQKSLEIYPHIDPAKWVIGGSITTAGAAISWVQQLFDTKGKVSELFERVTHQVDITPPIFIPHLSGMRCPGWDPKTKGAWLGLMPIHAQGDVEYAVFEGVAFALKEILERIQLLTDRQLALRVASRMDDSVNWLQTRADIYGIPLSIIQSAEPTALGALMLATIGLGHHASLTEAVASLVTIKNTLAPDPIHSRALHDRYADYQRAISVLATYWE
jgi:xylulokinase